jgi:hypothetical protein
MMEHMGIVDKLLAEDQISNSEKLNSEYRTAQMADEVYYSRIFSNYSGFAKVHTGLDDREYEEQFKIDRAVTNIIVERSERHARGQKLGLDELPQKFYARILEDKIRTLPEAFYANGYIVVQQKCFNVFSRFHLGSTDLVPAKIYQKDRKTEIEGPYYVFNFGCIKESFVPEKSSGMRQPFQTSEGLVWSGPPITPEDNQLAVSSNALSGPDLWFEKGLPNLIFISGRLRDALKAEKLHVPFKFFKCRVVEK